MAALYLASTTAQPTAGKAAEVFGPERVFTVGIATVIPGSLLDGFAQSLWMLIVSRVVIGLGTSCAYPTAMLLIQRRARDAGRPGQATGWRLRRAHDRPRVRPSAVSPPPCAYLMHPAYRQGRHAPTSADITL